MSLDRDELAARATAARAALLALCDALRPEAVAPAPSRPEWVRITGPDDAEKVTVGNVYAVRSHSSDGTPNTITNDRGEEWYICLPGYKPSRTWPSWEPCAAPGAAPSPAASPAPYVPKVGDVVQIDAYPSVVYTGYDENRSPFPHRGLRVDGVRDGWADGSRISYIRPATASERAAAGLPVDESAFDEAKEREAALDAYRAGTDGCIDPEGTKYPACRDSFSNGWLARARVAAKGGA